MNRRHFFGTTLAGAVAVLCGGRRALAKPAVFQSYTTAQLLGGTGLGYRDEAYQVRLYLEDLQRPHGCNHVDLPAEITGIENGAVTFRVEIPTPQPFRLLYVQAGDTLNLTWRGPHAQLLIGEPARLIRT